MELKNDDYTQLKGEIVGPPETPYDGGVFQLDIVIPETYPFNPPKVCIPIFLELGMAKSPIDFVIPLDLYHIRFVTLCPQHQTE